VVFEKVKKILDKEYSKEAASNWYFALGAATMTASFFAPSYDASNVLAHMGAIVVVVAAILRYGKGN
jgi:hypothetical protein